MVTKNTHNWETYIDGVISSSSLQRLEATNRKLERRFSEIKGFIHKFGTEAETPQLSTVDAKTPKILLMHLNTALMKSAEAGERKWSAIGVDEWIQAGRWWLMKVGFQIPFPPRLLLTSYHPC